MEHDQSALPGDPRGVWAREAARATSELAADAPWLPTAEDLPPWRTPDELHRNYSVVPSWWQRWLLPMIVAFVTLVVVPSAWLPALDPSSPKGVAILVLTAVLFTAVTVTAAVFVVREVRFHARRADAVHECFDLLLLTAVPVWAVFENRVRVSGGGDNVYDLQFVFDLRIPTETLRLQRRVAEAWLDEIAATYTSEDSARLPENFARSEPVHGAEIFGDGMHGVWIWEKSSVLPFQALGLSVEDPQTTSTLFDQNVAFMRRQSRDLRRRSKITR